MAVSVRVLRILEYVYPDAETAIKDQQRWNVQGTRVVGSEGSTTTIRSAVISPCFTNVEVK
jgi:hypothetical protein